MKREIIKEEAIEGLGTIVAVTGAVVGFRVVNTGLRILKGDEGGDDSGIEESKN